jgi:hypothetical protein
MYVSLASFGTEWVFVISSFNKIGSSAYNGHFQNWHMSLIMTVVKAELCPTKTGDTVGPSHGP